MSATFKAITLEKVLRGETQFPLTLTEFKAYLADVTKDVENLLFVLDYEQCKQLSEFYYEAFSIGITSVTTMSLTGRERSETTTILGDNSPTKLTALEENKEAVARAIPDFLDTPSDSEKPAPKPIAINPSKDPEKTSHCLMHRDSEMILRLVTFGLLKAPDAIVYGGDPTTPGAPVMVNLSAIPTALIKDALRDQNMFYEYQHAECRRLMERYFDSGSLFEINIPASVKAPLLKAVESGSCSREVFEKAFMEARNNLERNALPRFLKYAP
ncbi:hypothetical protein HK102_009709 [Quaeritorhiza haematococci]|nr:hypothetical protein HK102_009709 [Quaeritorhiza haematococci]